MKNYKNFNLNLDLFVLALDIETNKHPDGSKDLQILFRFLIFTIIYTNTYKTK